VRQRSIIIIIIGFYSGGEGLRNSSAYIPQGSPLSIGGDHVDRNVTSR
jgi:hypothetical protein